MIQKFRGARFSYWVSLPGVARVRPAKLSSCTSSSTRKVEKADEEKSTRPRRRIKGIIVQLSLSICAPFIAFMTWSLSVYGPKRLDLWQSAPIGGSFSQMAAKSIDFSISALFAPILMATINYIWFKWARTVAPYEPPKKPKPVHILSLLELSVSSAGSYDVAKLWRLMRSCRLQYILTAVLVLFSATATSFFVNLIAYEDFESSEGFRSSNSSALRYMIDPEISSGDNGYGASSNWNGTEGVLLPQYTALLQGVYYESYVNDTGQAWMNTDTMFPDSFEHLNEFNTRLKRSFITANATQESLGSLDRGIAELWDIPALRQTIFCQPATILNFTIEESKYERELQMQSFVNFADQSKTSNTISNVLGTLSEVNAANRNKVVALLFEENYSMDNNRVLIVIGVDQSDSTYLNYTCGNAPVTSTNLKTGSDTRPMNLCGVGCDIMQEDGHANLTKTSGTYWNVTSFAFNGARRSVPSPLALVQTLIELHPVMTISGAAGFIGNWRGSSPARTNSLDASAFNLLYTSAKLQSILYNAVLSSNRYGVAPVTYGISGRHTVLKYRITYVPGILLCGLVFLMGSAIVLIGMTLLAWGSVGLQTRRMVDGLQFITDLAASVQDDKAWDGANDWKRRYVEEWGQAVKLRYIPDEAGQFVRLAREKDDQPEVEEDIA